MFSTDTWLKIICALSVNAVLFGSSAVVVLSFPGLEQQWKYLLPAVIVASFALTPLGAAWVAPRMRLRNWGRKGWQEGDAISG